MTTTQHDPPRPAPATTRIRKPGTDDLAARTRAGIVGAHAQPRFDLTSQPWIPVVRDGGLTTVGLGELFLTAHLITDLAIPHALLRASMRRLLEALTADLIRRDRDLAVDDWEDRHAGNIGFTAEQVARLLQVHRDHLWLWHPRTPFLQDQRLASGLVAPQVDQAVQELVAHLPTGLSATWWVKAGEPAMLGGLSPAETALWLTARWFYAPSGNCATLSLPDGSTSSAHAGGAFAETVAPITHAFRVDGTSLFRSMLRGLPTALADGPPATAGADAASSSCAWLDREQPRPSADPLYQATLNPAAVLLTASDSEGNPTRLVRASTPVGKTIAKDLRDQAMNADQHRVTTLTATATGTRHTVRVEPTTLRGELLAAFHRAGFDGQALAGVITSRDCWLRTDADTADHERIELLLVRKVGTGANPVWAELVGVDLPARQVDPTYPNPHIVDHVRAAVQVAFDPVTGVSHRLKRAVCDLLAQPGPDGWKPAKPDHAVAKALTESAVHAWLARTATAFDRVLTSTAADDLDRWRAEVWGAARAAFDQVAAPYITSTRYAPRYAHALRQLTPRSTT